VTNMAALKLVDTSAMAQGDAALMQSYYSGADDRGGGWFVWNPSSVMKDDAGRYIEPTNSLGQAQPGRWIRLLKGETANVKMWGAYGDNAHDDTAAIQTAINACSTNNGNGQWTLELLFPADNYLVSQTLKFPCQLHLRGEGVAAGDGNTTLWMTNDLDVLRTWNADLALRLDVVTNYDHDLLVENLGLRITPQTATNGACIVIFQPGEAETVRNVNLKGGGYGVRCFGGGAPGLRLDHASAFDAAVALYSLEAYLPSGVYVCGGGSAVLDGCSGDSGRSNYLAGCSWFRAVTCYGNVTIREPKVEGQFGGGVFHYDAEDSSPYEIAGCMTIEGGTLNAEVSAPNVSSDLVVLTGADRTAALSMKLVSQYGFTNLIHDKLTGRKVLPECVAGGLTQARLGLSYEAWMNGIQPISRFVVGNTALVQFAPQAPGWYRVAGNTVQQGAFGGRFVISSYSGDCSELQVQAGTGSSDVLLQCLRSSKAEAGFKQPMVTQARAGSYFDTNNNANAYVGFLDLHVANLYSNTPYNALTIAHPIDGMVSVDTGSVQLLWPTNVLDANYSNSCTLVGCVTTNLTR